MKTSFNVLCAVLLSLVLGMPAFAAPAQFTAPVIAVAAGDTISVLAADKQQVTIRLYGIDCPGNGQAFGSRAKQATSDAVFGKLAAVRLLDTDISGRTMAVVSMPNGKSLNEHLVRNGLAWVSPQYCTDEAVCAPFRKLEQAARTAKRGLWGDKQPVPPWEWRRR